jgi:MarR family transcriptional regulator, transcriptional regulator for hemolysin
MPAKHPTTPTAEETAEDPRRLLAEHAAYVVQLAAQLREQALDAALASIGLTSNRLRVLSIVRRMKSSTMGELAFLTGIDRTTLTRTVDQLTAAELVTRREAPRDRRKVALVLTPKGARLHRSAIPMAAEINRTAFADISDERLREAIKVLRDAIGQLVTDPRDLETLMNLDRTARAVID